MNPARAVHIPAVGGRPTGTVGQAAGMRVSVSGPSAGGGGDRAPAGGDGPADPAGAGGRLAGRFRGGSLLRTGPRQTGFVLPVPPPPLRADPVRAARQPVRRRAPRRRPGGASRAPRWSPPGRGGGLRRQSGRARGGVDRAHRRPPDHLRAGHCGRHRWIVGDGRRSRSACSRPGTPGARRPTACTGAPGCPTGSTWTRCRCSDPGGSGCCPGRAARDDVSCRSWPRPAPAYDRTFRGNVPGVDWL